MRKCIFSVGQLFWVVLAIAAAHAGVAPFVLDSRNGLEEATLQEATVILHILESSEAMHGVDAINSWLAGDLRDDHPFVSSLTARQAEFKGEDAWGVAFRCVERSPGKFGVYSCGPDLMSRSLGNDSDDVSTWNGFNRAHWNYMHRMAVMPYLLGIGTVVGLVGYVFVRFALQAVSGWLTSRQTGL